MANRFNPEKDGLKPDEIFIQAGRVESWAKCKGSEDYFGWVGNGYVGNRHIGVRMSPIYKTFEEKQNKKPSGIEITVGIKGGKVVIGKPKTFGIGSLSLYEGIRIKHAEEHAQLQRCADNAGFDYRMGWMDEEEASWTMAERSPTSHP